jgi:hypothetical protein
MVGCFCLSNIIYMHDILERVGIFNWKTYSTHNDTFAKVSSNGVPVSDAIDYNSLVGTP